MYLPPLQPVNNKDVYINGDVTIHPSATLAPGVVLQAAPNSRIIIGADVSLGMGTVLNASQGEIVISSGATLGAGVLIVGTSTIGSNACVGTAATIFNSSVDSMAVIAPGSLVGDSSRAYNISETPNQASKPPSSTAKVEQKNGFKAQTKSEPKPETNKVSSPEAKSVESEPEVMETKKVEVGNGKVSSKSVKDPNSVVGRVYINQLLLTLFPHYQSLEHKSPPNELK